MSGGGAPYDVAVVGAGLGGLTAACKLALAGARVVVVEQHHKVGGVATNFPRQGFLFDVSLHNLGPLAEHPSLPRQLEELGVASAIEFLSFPYFQRVLLGGQDLVIPKGLGAFGAALAERFPEEAAGASAFLGALGELVAELDEIERADLVMDQLEARYPMLPLKFPRLVTLAERTLGELLDEHVQHPVLRGLLGCCWWIYGLPPSQLAAILYGVPTVRYIEHGGGIIAGTSQRLSEALAARLVELGGELRLRAPVTAILWDEEQGRVAGVETARGEEIRAGAVISNAPATTTILELLPEEAVPRRYRKKIERATLSTSCFQLFLGLDREPAALGLEDHALSVFLDDDHETCWAKVLEGRPEESFYFVTNTTALDPGVAPPGQGVLSVMTLDRADRWRGLSPEEYRRRKAAVAERLTAQLERHLPGLREHVLVSEAMTPLSIERVTGHPDGAIYGFAQTNDQSGVFRFGNETPVPGLYLAGAYTYPGAGYASVIASGYGAARAFLARSGA